MDNVINMMDKLEANKRKLVRVDSDDMRDLFTDIATKANLVCRDMFNAFKEQTDVQDDQVIIQAFGKTFNQKNDEDSSHINDSMLEWLDLDEHLLDLINKFPKETQTILEGAICARLQDSFTKGVILDSEELASINMALICVGITKPKDVFQCVLRAAAAHGLAHGVLTMEEVTQFARIVVDWGEATDDAGVTKDKGDLH